PPIRASITTNTSEAVANAKNPGRSRLEVNALRANHTPRTNTTNDNRRWLNSIAVSMLGARGTTVPLHMGQWLPQPAPEPEMRTNAPCRITTTLSASVTHARRHDASEKFVVPSLACSVTWGLLAFVVGRAANEASIYGRRPRPSRP